MASCGPVPIIGAMNQMGRIGMVVALVLVIVGRYSEANPLGMIVILGLLAIAFATQLLPVTVDMLFIKKGTRLGALWGIVTGLVVVFILSPFFSMLAGNFMGDTLAILIVVYIAVDHHCTFELQRRLSPDFVAGNKVFRLFAQNGTHCLFELSRVDGW